MSKLDGKENEILQTSSEHGEIRTTREESMEDFSPEWCQELLNDPTYKPVSHSTRVVGGPNGSSFNSLMGRTLFTDRTIRAMRVLHKPADKNKETGNELLALISLGDEMCSHANVLHGGINTTIIDEIGGAFAGLAVEEYTTSLMAVNFNVNLRKAVRAPGIVLVRAWIERPPEGRKF